MSFVSWLRTVKARWIAPASPPQRGRLVLRVEQLEDRLVPSASPLVSYYPLNGSVADLLGVNNPSATGGISFVPGKNGQGVTFTPGGYIDIPDSPTLDNPQLTLSAWARPDGPGPNNDGPGSAIVTKNFSGTDGCSFGMYWSALDDRFRVFAFGENTGQNSLTSWDAFAPGQFYHVAATYDGHTADLYVNGVLEGQTAITQSIPYDYNTWEIGSTSSKYRNAGFPRTWNGVIDQAAIFNRALSASEIQQDYIAGPQAVGQATPTVSVANAGGTYNGNIFAATATVAGLDGVAGTTLEGVGLTLDYKQLDANGNVIADLGAAAPSAAGTYQVTASFAGSADYTAATSPSVAFTIAKATPTFGAVNTTVITDGTPTVTLTGTISDGALIPTGRVTVTVDGVSQAVPIGANGTFSAAFATGSLSVGTHSVSFSYAGDQNFVPAQANGSLDVTYSVLALFDQTHAKQAGSTLPVKIQLATATGQDVSAGNLTVTALGIAATTDTTDAVGSALPADVGALIPVQAAGGSNPGNVFRFQGGANPFYMYNLVIPDGLAAGTYRLYFSVLGDPLVHWVTFTVG